MARVTYGIVVAALAALVAGFFVHTSTLPLIVSIAFSAIATLLILIGWGRRLRLESEGERPPEAEPEIDFIDLGEEEAKPAPPKRRRERRREPKALPVDAELTFELPKLEAEEEAEPPPPPPRRKQRAEYVRRDTSPAPTPARRNKVVIVPGRGRYHRSSCRFANRSEAKEVTAATARRRGYEPCSVCGPDD